MGQSALNACLLLNNCADVPECCSVFKDEERGWGGKVEPPSLD